MRVTLTSLATVLVLVLVLGASVMSAGVPNTINYQGRLTDAAGAPVPDAGILVKFTIYDAAIGGTDLWNSGFQSVTTTDGLFEYVLGSVVTLPDLFGPSSTRYLGITVSADPEISPRTRFRSEGYAFQSAKSDLAADANSLGGAAPSFYLAWSNMTGMPTGFADGVDDTASSIDWTALTNIPSGFGDGVDDTSTSIDWTALTSVPAGFADGTDDEGIDLATGDARYLEVLGDTLKGDLQFNGTGVGGRIAVFPNTTNIELKDAGNMKSVLWGQAWGELDLFDSPGNSTVILNATSGSGGRLQLNDATGASSIFMDGGQTGNSSVIFPTGAISSLEMLDEPGITANINGNTVVTLPFNGVTMADLVTTTITIPASGYILLYATTFQKTEGTTGANVGIYQIDETSGGGVIPTYYTWNGPGSSHNTFVHYSSVALNRVYLKTSPGTYTFRLEALQSASTGGVLTCFRPMIMALFVPTSYGSVFAVNDQPGDHPDAQAVSITGVDGTVTTGYKMDLRYYEEKARQAEITAQKAELEKLKARTELERARQGGNEK